jgi:hypothetical protein
MDHLKEWEKRREHAFQLLSWSTILAISVALIALVFITSKCGLKENKVITYPTPGPTVTVAPSPGAPECDKVTFEDDVKPLINAKCAGCHAGFSKYEVASKGIGEFLRRVGLSSGDPRRMPKYPAPELGVDEKELLRKWQADGLVPDKKCESQVSTSPVDIDYIEDQILRDLEGIERNDQPFARYLVASDLANDNLAISKLAVDKLLNSLVSESRDISLSTVVDQKKSIYRFDLRTFELERFNWLQIEAKDRLNLVSKTNKGKTIQLLVATRKPWLHARNFIEIVTNESRIYYDILKVPFTFQELTRKLGVDYDQDLQDLRATLIGTNQSPLTTQKNRLLSRHDSDDGFFWTTYDIAPGGDNLFNNPLLEATRSKRLFRFDASEVIFSLPNGLMGFALFNSQGKIQNEAPVEVVRDYQSQVAPAPVIKNPVSCFRCHGGGILESKDEIRQHVISNGSEFDVEDIERVKSLYKRDESNRVIFKLDNKRYAEALSKLGIQKDQPDPINVIRDEFRLNWDMPKVAAFLFLSEERFLSRLNQSDILREKVGQLLLPGGNVTFDQLVDVLPIIVKEFRLFEELNNGE